MGKAIGASVLLMVFVVPIAYLWWSVMPLINEGDAALTAAYEKESLGERYLSLNRAVTAYLLAEKRSPLLFRDWMLSERLGSALFALSDYPQASYYYWTAFLDHPRKETRDRLLAALSRLHSQESPQVVLSAAPSYVILTLLAVFLLTILSIVFSYKRIALLCGLMGLFCFGYLVYARYFTPIEAIVLQDGPLLSAIGGTPLFTLTAGDKVEVIDLQGGAVKVRTADDSIGYFTEKGVRVLR